ncbi:response regulator [Thermotoga sp. KOL6]|uniref:response regulator n=1 Tax=Thermotoga sp. KOL6 TaxID=126741 RepID=UPI000C789E0F|nr:response regulator [Thermotoga sp. KOL6]PLV58325.1 hypothetical protein AS005_08135 [Thermotoga sp. KOL6]
MEATILVLDESKITFLAVKNALEKDGFEVLWAKDIREAVSILRGKKVDLVFVDVFEGEESLNLIRKIREEFPETKVVVLSAYVNKDLVVGSVKAGAFDYILKPFRQDYLLQRVKRILSSQTPYGVTVSIRRNIEDLELALKFGDIVKKEIKRCSRSGGHFCIMYVKFENITREFEKIKKVFRETDYIFPISATEYLFVLTLTGKHGITAVTERMKDKLNQNFSYVFVCYPDDGKTYNEIIQSLKDKITTGLGGNKP